MLHTLDTLNQRLDLEESITKAMRMVEVEDQTDSGEWVTRCYADEKTAVDHEVRMARRGVPTRRKAP